MGWGWHTVGGTVCTVARRAGVHSASPLVGGTGGEHATTHHGRR
jgi:hypothetical protein